MIKGISLEFFEEIHVLNCIHKYDIRQGRAIMFGTSISEKYH